MAYIISADDIKRSLAGYHPDRAEEFHSTSAKLADRMLAEALKNRPEATVILMAGGSASGKSEYVSVYLEKRPAIILDGTLPTFAGAKIKIDRAVKAGETVEVHLVLPDDLVVAFAAFVNRDRKFSSKHFYRTHSSSRNAVMEIMRHFPDIPLTIITSYLHGSGSGRVMSFRELGFRSRPAQIEFLAANQYTEDKIKHLTRGSKS